MNPCRCGLKPMILVYISGDWDVHWGYGILSHGLMNVSHVWYSKGIQQPKQRCHVRVSFWSCVERNNKHKQEAVANLGDSTTILRTNFGIPSKG